MLRYPHAGGRFVKKKAWSRKGGRAGREWNRTRGTAPGPASSNRPAVLAYCSGTATRWTFFILAVAAALDERKSTSARLVPAARFLTSTHPAFM